MTGNKHQQSIVMKAYIYHPARQHLDCNPFRPHYGSWGHCAWGKMANWASLGHIGGHGGVGLFFFFAILVALLVFFLALGRSDRSADKGK
jgi:hypothetical protein